MYLYPHNPHARKQYAQEMVRRYVELRRWAMHNWPNTEQPLRAADFVASDRELQLLLGSRLHCGNQETRAVGATYEDITPMPWP